MNDNFDERIKVLDRNSGTKVSEELSLNPRTKRKTSASQKVRKRTQEKGKKRTQQCEEEKIIAS